MGSRNGTNIRDALKVDAALGAAREWFERAREGSFENGKTDCPTPAALSLETGLLLFELAADNSTPLIESLESQPVEA